jgi:hypothetical protein
MRVGISAQNVGQHHRIGVVAFGPSDRPAFPVAGHRHRVDRVDLPSGRPQCGDQQTAGSFDRYRDRLVLAVTGSGQQFE